MPEQSGKLGKIVVVVLLLLLIGLGGTSFYFYDQWRKAEAATDEAETIPSEIQAMTCDQAKLKLSDVYNDPDLIRSYQKMTITNIKGSEISFETESKRPLAFNITKETSLVKAIDGGTEALSKEALKKDLMTDIKINPAGELVYLYVYKGQL